MGDTGYADKLTNESTKQVIECKRSAPGADEHFGIRVDSLNGRVAERREALAVRAVDMKGRSP
jgi:hypothetical protein